MNCFTLSAPDSTMPLTQFLKRNLAFFIPMFTLVLVGILFLVTYPKGSIHLVMNSWYHPNLDPFFTYFTWLGDGLIYAVFIPLLSLIRWRWFLGLLVTGIITLLLTGFLKQVVFEGELRPVKYFENKQELRLVEGIDQHHYNSFPSGHTLAAFACYGFFAFLVRNGVFKFTFFLIAFLVGYSRIYLSQHFLQDVVAGAVLGTVAAMLGYYIMTSINWPGQEARLKLKPRSNAINKQE